MSEFREMMEQREQSQACLDSAESRQSSAFRQMRRKRQQLSNEESIAILEKATAGMLGNRYNPNDDESLQKEIESGFSRMLMIRFDIEHLTGKEAIELVGMRNARG